MANTAHWLTDEEQELWRLMITAAGKISRTIDDALQATSNLSSSEFAVLVVLSEAEDRECRLRDLCTALSWDRSRASHLVSRMERRGLVTKGPCPDDARGVLVTLTDEGMERIVDAAPDHVEVVRRLVFDGLELVDVDDVKRLLNNILETDVSDLLAKNDETDDEVEAGKSGCVSG